HGIVQADGHGVEAILGVLLVHLDQTREFLFASQSGVGPEIDDDDLALEAFDDVAEAGVLDNLDLDLVAGTHRQRGRQRQPHNACHNSHGVSSSILVGQAVPDERLCVIRYSVPFTRRPPGSPARATWVVYSSPSAVRVSRSVNDGTRSWSVSRHTP